MSTLGGTFMRRQANRAETGSIIGERNDPAGDASQNPGRSRTERRPLFQALKAAQTPLRVEYGDKALVREGRACGQPRHDPADILRGEDK